MHRRTNFHNSIWHDIRTLKGPSFFFLKKKNLTKNSQETNWRRAASPLSPVLFLLPPLGGFHGRWPGFGGMTSTMDQSQRAARAHHNPARPAVFDLFNRYLGVLPSSLSLCRNHFSSSPFPVFYLAEKCPPCLRRIPFGIPRKSRSSRGF